MEIKDGRGMNKTKESEENREKIAKWFERNPGSTKKQCCDAIGISYKTVQKHLKVISNGKVQKD